MFGQPRIYTVHLDPARLRAHEHAVFVREGFSVAAFALGVLWVMYHRMWRTAAYLLVLGCVLSGAYESGWLTLPGVMVVQWAVQLWLGLNGRDLLRTHLEQQGYITADIIAAENLLHAERRFFERYA